MTAEELVRRVITEQLAPITSYVMETSLEELDADSLDAVRMVQDFEEALDVEVSNQEISKLKTVGDMVELLKRYGKGKLTA
jgi:acyl carrier protein